MNRLLGQQTQLASRPAARSPSTDSQARNGMSDTPKASAKSGSPHIADQTLSPAALSRKPVNADPGSAGGSNQKNTNGDIYMFENTPTPSARNSVMDLEMDPQVKLEDYDWAELEEQFAKRMEAFKAEEEGIWEEWKAWGEIFKAWASTISVHDEDRASKRLRTRIAFTQGSEESLEAKRQHYIKVVQAFESALALLGSRNSAHNFI